ncbi:MAG: hypothetical protein DHS20C12_10580 [Pseudohongiella sp.]|nr:MAG: hypothetical protein DHS20C12_10580 [Pseudohongiella sp.]
MPNQDLDEHPLLLSKWAKVTIGVFSFIFGLIFLPTAIDPVNPDLGLFNFAPLVFCLLLTGACLLPEQARGYCGDLVAVSVLFIAIWFMSNSYLDPEPGDDPAGFAVVFGGGALSYLYYRYKKYLLKKAPNS